MLADLSNRKTGIRAATPADEICFKPQEFATVFTATTRDPDHQLAGFLRSHRASNHYPTFEELHRTLFHTNTSIYGDFDASAPIEYASQVTEGTAAFLASKLTKPVHFMVEVGSYVGN